MSITQADRLHDRRWVVQCALSRVCGGCAMTLARPVVFLGTPEEVARNGFHLPPMHRACAEELLGSPAAEPSWRVVETSRFEFVRPNREDRDQRPRFEPNSLL